MSHRDDSDNLNAELDALLDQARWPEPAAEALPRLRRHWLALARPHRSPLLRIGWPAAAAAALIAAIVGTWLLWTSPARAPLARHTSPAAPAIAPPVPLAPPAARLSPPEPAPSRPPQSHEITARPPTPRERLLLMQAHSGGAPVDVRRAVHAALDAAAGDDVAAAVLSLRRLRSEVVERELTLAFATAQDPLQRQNAIQLLSEFGGTASAALLTRAARDPRFTEYATPGVARLAGVPALVEIVRTGPAAPRSAAIEQLLAVGSEPAVNAFLSLVLDEATRTEALAALHAAEAPPVSALIAALDHASMDRRFAAARALGTLCDRQDVGFALRRMVGANHHRREALAALLSCPSREAATFISTARAQASIDAEVRAVQSELQRIF